MFRSPEKVISEFSQNTHAYIKNDISAVAFDTISIVKVQA